MTTLNLSTDGNMMTNRGRHADLKLR